MIGAVQLLGRRSASSLLGRRSAAVAGAFTSSNATMLMRGSGSSSSSSYYCSCRPCSSTQSSSTTSSSNNKTRGGADASINSVTLVGVVHDIQTGFVFEDAVTQFTITTTSLDTTNSGAAECVVEKDHHTVRCFGDVFSQEIKSRIKEGNVVCVNGRLRLNPQLEPSCNKYYYFPFIHVQPPHGQVSVVYGDRRSPPAATNPAPATADVK